VFGFFKICLCFTGFPILWPYTAACKHKKDYNTFFFKFKPVSSKICLCFTGFLILRLAIQYSLQKRKKNTTHF
jgi:hypothetical protein